MIIKLPSERLLQSQALGAVFIESWVYLKNLKFNFECKLQEYKKYNISFIFKNILNPNKAGFFEGVFFFWERSILFDVFQTNSLEPFALFLVSIPW